jgi:hypothetical protein
LRRRSGKSFRKIIVTPGNHDALCGHIQEIVRNVGSWLQERNTALFRIFKFLLRRIIPPINQLQEAIKALKELLNTADPTPASDALAAYHWFVDEAKCYVTDLKVPYSATGHVTFIPFDSVSLEPILMNIGATRNTEFITFRDRARAANDPYHIIIALLHHNPISSPEVIDDAITHGYNSMPGGTAYIKEMQDAGVDIILYGHQHEHVCSYIDYSTSKFGHVYLIGSKSSTCGRTPGFNIIELSGPFDAKLDHCEFNTTGSVSRHSIPLVFEKQSMKDSHTATARREIRHYRFDGGIEIWDDMLKAGARTLFMGGPRQQELIEEIVRLKDVLANSNMRCVRILITDPSLFSMVKLIENTDAQQRLNKMWDYSKFSWQDQADVAEHILKQLEILYNGLPPDQKRKLDVRLAHTLIPIGFRSRNMGSSDGEMVIRLLPVGVFSDVERPHMYITYRCERAIYSFYAKYLKELWRKSSHAPFNMDNIDVPGKCGDELQF